MGLYFAISYGWFCDCGSIGYILGIDNFMYSVILMVLLDAALLSENDKQGPVL